MEKFNQHDRFGNPILGYCIDADSVVWSAIDNYKGPYDKPTTDMANDISDTVISRYHDYGINSLFFDDREHSDDEKLDSFATLLTNRFTIVWNRYARVAKAYEMELDDIEKASEALTESSDTSSKDFGKTNKVTRNLTDETKDMKVTEDGNNDTTGYDLPNKSVSSPYGNPSDYSKDTNHSDTVTNGKVIGTGTVDSADGGNESVSESGHRTAKATQLKARADYIREMKRNLYNDIAEDLKPCFCTLYY